MLACGDDETVFTPRTARFQLFQLHAVQQRIVGVKLLERFRRHADAVILEARFDGALGRAAKGIHALRLVIGFRILQIDFRRQAVEQGEILQDHIVPQAHAGALRGRILLHAGRVKRADLVTQIALVLAFEHVHRQVQLLFAGQCPHQLGQQGVRMPVIGIGRRGAATIRLFAIAVHVDGQALQRGAERGRARQRVCIAAVGGGAAIFIGDIVILPLAQVILGRLGDEGHAATQARTGAAGGRRARIDAHFAEGFWIEIVTARAEGVEGRAVRFGRRVGQRDAIELQADPVAFQAADVVARIARTIPHAAAARGCHWRADQGKVARDTGHVRHVAALQVVRRDDRPGAGATHVILLGIDDDFREDRQLGRLLCRHARVDGGRLRGHGQHWRGKQAQQGGAQHQIMSAGRQVGGRNKGGSVALRRHSSHDDPV